MGRSMVSVALLITVFISCDAAYATAPSEINLVLSLPELSWSLEINEPGFIIQQKEIAPDGDAVRLQAANKETGVVLSAFLEHAPRTGGSKECREYYWATAEKSHFKKEQIRKYESGPISVVEYIVPEHMGVKVNQKHVNAYLAEGDYWIDVHLSKAAHRIDENDPFLPILKKIQINRDYVPTVVDRFQYGNIYYRAKDYRKAAFHYGKALELDKRETSLGRSIWKVLVDQLGISYGISGELPKAKDLFEWAITQEPEYAMFHYNLACAFAEMGNREQALNSLRMAIKYKENILPGESFPDPKEDSSFTKYLQDNDFRTEFDKIE